MDLQDLIVICFGGFVFGSFAYIAWTGRKGKRSSREPKNK